MHPFISKLLKDPFFHGSIYLTAASFFVGFLNYIFNIVAARLVGPAGFGDIVAFIAVVAVVSTPLNAIGNVLIQKIGRRGDRDALYARALEQWFFQTARKLWPLVVLSLILIPFTPQLTNISPVVAYSVVPFIFYGLIGTFYDGVLQGLHMFFWISMISIIVGVLKLAGVGFASITIYQLAAIMIFLHLSNIVKIGAGAWILHNRVPNPDGSLKIEKKIHHILTDKQIIITATSLFAGALLNNIDIVYVKRMFSSDMAGIYAGWSLMAKLLLYAIGPILTLSYIFFTSKRKEAHHTMVLIGGMLIFMLIGCIVFAAYRLFGTLLITSILGDKFLRLGPYMGWAALFGIGYVMVSFVNGYFLARGSKLTLILPCSIPAYIAGLFLFPKQIGDVMMLNTYFIFAVLGVYVLMFFTGKNTTKTDQL